MLVLLTGYYSWDMYRLTKAEQKLVGRWEFCGFQEPDTVLHLVYHFREDHTASVVMFIYNLNSANHGSFGGQVGPEYTGKWYLRNGELRYGQFADSQQKPLTFREKIMNRYDEFINGGNNLMSHDGKVTWSVVKKKPEYFLMIAKEVRNNKGELYSPYLFKRVDEPQDPSQ